MSDGRLGGTSHGEQEPVTYELATWGVRAAAYLLDLFVLFVLGVAISLVAVVAKGGTDTPEARDFAELLLLSIWLPLALLYAPLLLMRSGERNGQTLGKQALSLRVVRESGEQVTLGNALLREVIGRQLLIPVTRGLYALIDNLWPLWDAHRQCLHDKVARTRVVRVAPLEAAATTFGSPSPQPAQPAQPTSGGATVPSPPPVPDAPVRDGWLPPRPPSR